MKQTKFKMEMCMSCFWLILPELKKHKHSFEIISIFSEVFPQDKSFILGLFFFLSSSETNDKYMN